MLPDAMLPSFPSSLLYNRFRVFGSISEDSPPEERIVTSLPAVKYGSDHPDDYGHDLSPEKLLPEPHCPFKSDVFQLGKMFLSHFRASAHNICLAFDLIDAIAASGDRISRPH